MRQTHRQTQTGFYNADTYITGSDALLPLILPHYHCYCIAKSKAESRRCRLHSFALSSPPTQTLLPPPFTFNPFLFSSSSSPVFHSLIKTL